MRRSRACRLPRSTGPRSASSPATPAGIEAFEDRLRDEAVTYQRLLTGGAFHSSLMAGVVDPLTAAAREVRIGPAADSVRVERDRATWMTETDLRDPAYWGRHARQTVRFGASVDTLLTWGAAVFLEVGPGQALGSLVRQVARTRENRTLGCRDDCRRCRRRGTTIRTARASCGRSGACGSRVSCPTGRRTTRASGGCASSCRRIRSSASGTGPIRPTPTRFGTVQPAPAAASGRANLDAWFAIPSWSRSQPARRWRPLRSTDGSCFLDESTPARTACRTTRAPRTRGHTRSRRRTSSSERRITNTSSVRQSRSDYDALFADLRASDRLPGSVLHLWMLSGRPTAGVADDSFAEACLARGFSACCIWRRRGAISRRPPACASWSSAIRFTT